MKSASLAGESGENWVRELITYYVLLGLKASIKDDIGLSSAECASKGV